MRISRSDPEDPTGKRRRHFEISIDSPFTVLNCRATQANTALPQYSGRDGPMSGQQNQMSCGCPDAHVTDRSPSSSTAHLALVEQDAASPNGSRLGLDSVTPSALPHFPRAAHLQSSSRLNGPLPRRGPADRDRDNALPSPIERDRPIHLLRHPSFNPPAFDADEPPPPVPAELMTPPPHYDVIVGTPSVDGLADYFARLAVYEGPGQQCAQPAGGLSLRRIEEGPLGLNSEIPRNSSDVHVDSDPFASLCGAVLGNAGADDESSDSGEEDVARPHRRGRVNVVNPRTPGGRLVPSRSLEIERPVIRLDMAGVVRRGG